MESRFFIWREHSASFLKSSIYICLINDENKNLEFLYIRKILGKLYPKKIKVNEKKYIQ